MKWEVKSYTDPHKSLIEDDLVHVRKLEEKAFEEAQRKRIAEGGVAPKAVEPAAESKDATNGTKGEAKGVGEAKGADPEDGKAERFVVASVFWLCFLTAGGFGLQQS